MTIATSSPQITPTAPKRIAVDFDGTLCDLEYPGIGKPKAGAKEAMRLFRALGFTIVIYTCRTCHWDYDIYGGDPSKHTLDRQTVQDMVSWLNENEIEYDEIDDGSRGKVSADYYIDDKGIRFEDNWLEVAWFVYSREMRKQSGSTRWESVPSLIEPLKELMLGSGAASE